jgi:hypothetical protein
MALEPGKFIEKDDVIYKVVDAVNDTVTLKVAFEKTDAGNFTTNGTGVLIGEDGQCLKI